MAGTSDCLYKGKKYRLLWSGKTKFGERAHLSFLDGSKDFWVSADEVSSAPATTFPSKSRRGVCRECRGPLVDAPHHRAMGGLCGSCAFDEYDC